MKQICTRTITALVLVATLVTVAHAQGMGLKFRDTPLTEAVRTYATFHNMNVEWDPTLPLPDPKHTFTGDLGNYTKDQGLAELLDPTYRFELRGNVYYITKYDRGQHGTNLPGAADQPFQQHGGGARLGTYIPPAVRIEQPTLRSGDPDFMLQPDICCDGQWHDGTTGLRAGWYRNLGNNYFAPFTYPYERWRMISPHSRYRLSVMLGVNTSGGHPGQVGFGVHSSAGFGVTPTGIGAYGNVGAGYIPGGGSFMDSGWYGMPLFDFQLEEMRMQYKDYRRIAKLRIKGQQCNNDCLENIHILVILTNSSGEEREFYLTAANAANSWHEDGVDVPINTNTYSAKLYIVKEDVVNGTLRGFEREMILMPPAIRGEKDNVLTIHPEMFNHARQIKIFQQHVSVEFSPGRYQNILSRPNTTQP